MYLWTKNFYEMCPISENLYLLYYLALVLLPSEFKSDLQNLLSIPEIELEEEELLFLLDI